MYTIKQEPKFLGSGLDCHSFDLHWPKMCQLRGQDCFIFRREMHGSILSMCMQLSWTLFSRLGSTPTQNVREGKETEGLSTYALINTCESWPLLVTSHMENLSAKYNIANTVGKTNSLTHLCTAGYSIDEIDNQWQTTPINTKLTSNAILRAF